MERTEQICSGVQELVSSTNLSLPAGAVTYPGSFLEMAEALMMAKEHGINAGVACGRFTYMFSEEDCRLVQRYIRLKHSMIIKNR